MTNLDFIREKLKNVKDSDGNIICTVDDDLLNATIGAIKNYTFKDERIRQNLELDEQDKDFYLNEEWTNDSNPQDRLGNCEIGSKFDRISIVYKDKKAESIYLSTMPGLSIKKYISPDKSTTITVEGFVFGYHKLDDGITRDCDIEFIVGNNGKIEVVQNVSDCNQELRILDRTTSCFFFDSFEDFEDYHNNLDEILASYTHKKINMQK